MNKLEIIMYTFDTTFVQNTRYFLIDYKVFKIKTRHQDKRINKPFKKCLGPSTIRSFLGILEVNNRLLYVAV